MRIAIASYGIRPNGMEPGPMVCGLEVPYVKVECIVCDTVWNREAGDRCPECDWPAFDPDQL